MLTVKTFYGYDNFVDTPQVITAAQTELGSKRKTNLKFLLTLLTITAVLITFILLIRLFEKKPAKEKESRQIATPSQKVNLEQSAKLALNPVRDRNVLAYLESAKKQSNPDKRYDYYFNAFRLVLKQYQTSNNSALKSLLILLKEEMAVYPKFQQKDVAF